MSFLFTRKCVCHSDSNAGYADAVPRRFAWLIQSGVEKYGQDSNNGSVQDWAPAHPFGGRFLPKALYLK
jgi:hypothetical protein